MNTEPKRCANCEQELPRPIDEFGDVRKPLCISCWLNPETTEKRTIDETIKNLEEDINDLDREISRVEDELASLESERIFKKRELRKLREGVKKDEESALAGMMVIDL